MEISATVSSSAEGYSVSVSTGPTVTELRIPAKPNGKGSAINGGELLFLALATCYCNDLYREASKAGISISAVDVRVHGMFGAEGEAAETITYDVSLLSPEDEGVVSRLIQHTDTVAEIHNTIRSAVPVRLGSVEIR